MWTILMYTVYGKNQAQDSGQSGSKTWQKEHVGCDQ